MNIILFAWNNLWRNWKRTVITSTAIVLAVILSSVMSSMQEGTYVRMIDNVVKFYSGYIQVFQNNYWETRSIDDTFIDSDTVKNLITKNRNVSAYAPRIESFSLLSYKNSTKGAAIIGIDPELENGITKVERWLFKGHFFNEKANQILLAENLAKTLGADIGDTITLIGQGYHGESAAGLFVLCGILRFPSPQLNGFAAYMRLADAQKYLSAENLLTSYVIIVNDNYKVSQTQLSIKKELPNHFQVMSWQEMQPELVQMIDGDRAGGVIMKAILYLIIGFGLLGTVIMMISERKKEMGVLVSIGMQKHMLARILYIETLFIGLIGTCTGLIISIVLVYILELNPIHMTGDVAKAYETFGIEPVIYFSKQGSIFFTQLYIVFIIALVVGIFPIVKALRLNPVKSIRS